MKVKNYNIEDSEVETIKPGDIKKEVNPETKKIQEQDEEKDFLSRDFLSVLDNVITKSEFSKEFKINNSLTIELRVLETGELLVAESRVGLNPNLIPTDITYRARNLSILAAATVSLNGIPIKRKEMTEEENSARVTSLYKKFLKMPASLADEMCSKYEELSIEQREFINKDFGELSKDIENF